MQYLGGKSQIGREIAAVVSPAGVWWEPFCGGLSVSACLAQFGPGVISDMNQALIELFLAMRGGWIPPLSVSESDYEHAKQLSDVHPLKAFIGFGCSYGGKWFGGYARPGAARGHGRWWMRNPAQQAAASLSRKLAAVVDCDICCASFFEVEPAFGVFDAIYCDPPYAGRTGYACAANFDSGALWQRCREWAAQGTRVFVSEYAAPAGCAEVVWEKLCAVRVQGGVGRMQTERLFKLDPSELPAVV